VQAEEVAMSPSRDDRAGRTPLFPLYERYGARVVDFHGWELPVQFSGIIEEHRTVRSCAGLFDVSHMGEIEISGPGAFDFVQRIAVNDVAKAADGQVQYSAMCFEDGGIVDDITVFRYSAELFMLCVNASNTAKDLQWILKHKPADVEVNDLSGQTALLALQGPKAEFIIKPLVDVSIANLRYYRFVEAVICGVKATISRTGYTGEDGFEIFLRDSDAQGVWQKIMAAGEPLGMKPAGLGARDTLRLEMKYALYGNDIDETTDPFEAGLGWITSMKKGDFIGREGIAARVAKKDRRRLVGFQVQGRTVARQGYAILSEGAPVGTVTSGTWSPSLEKPVGMGYVPAALAAPGTPLAIEVRRQRVAAEVVKPPFYKEGSARK
jgi:aminomethyltransferase